MKKEKGEKKKRRGEKRKKRKKEKGKNIEKGNLDILQSQFNG